MSSSSPFSRVLVANRGEIAVRIIRTLRSLGISPAAVYSDADADARHVRDADVAIRLGPAPAAESYLHVERLVDAARRCGADAVHPGYGFLSESPRLAAACDAAGLVFVGPPVAAIEAMGDKVRARELVAAVGVPVVPGRDATGLDDDQLLRAAADVGYPLLLKPAAGGGGKGMRLVDTPGELLEHAAAARREAAGAFGDDRLLIERYVTRPRHIEIQVLADRHGGLVHLGERECTLQRRHQKIVEEAPSPVVTREQRERLGGQALAAARACGYVGAGTVELVMAGDRPDECWFLEMNTRLQVEHPVTELVYGLDLVEWQLRVAAGEPLPFRPEDLILRGHAVEARVYAEDPARGFLPSTGTVRHLVEPTGEGIRVDSALLPGLAVGTDYDPLLAKVVAHGTDRAEALARLDAALGALTILGLTTNVGFVRRLLRHPDVQGGRLDTELVGREVATLAADPVPLPALVAVASRDLVAPERADDPWTTTIGWRHGGPTRVVHRLDGDGHAVAVGLRWHGRDTFAVTVDEDEERPATVRWLDGSHVAVTVDGDEATLSVARDGATTWVGAGGSAWAITEQDPTAHRLRRLADDPAHGAIRSPMPGRVVTIDVHEGDQVDAGQRVAIVEAMKMEHALVAPHEGIVATVHVTVGASVSLDQVIVTTAPRSPEAP